MTSMHSADRGLRQRIESLAAAAALGHFRLPPKLASALDAERRVDAQLADARARAQSVDGPEGVVDQLAAAVLAAASEGAPPPALTDAVAAAEDTERRAAIEVRILERAAEAAESAALYCVTGETIITTSLQPAHAAVLDELRRLVPKLAPYRVSEPERMLQAPAEARNAFAALIGLADKYQAVRAARQVACDMEGGRPSDIDGVYSELRNLPALHGAAWGARYMTKLPRPGPEHHLERMLWIVSGEPEPWCPTREQQDEAVRLADEAARPKRGRPTSFAVIG